MIDTNTIKDRILSFAYQGKLVEPSQLSNDSIEAIHVCIKGYIPVSEEEHLITIPKEWKWTRLGYVTSNHGQVTPSDTFSYIDVGTLDNVNHRLSFSENIVEAKDAPSRAKKVVEAGDVIYSTVRPYLHNICIIDKDFSYTPIASTAFCVMHANEEALDNKFLFYWLLTKEFDKYSNGDPSKGALYPAIGEKDLLKGVIPLPAVSEQKAIVAKIEAVFEILDKIDALQNQYASNQEALKSKLIDAAIQGKLTEQFTEDGTAEELINRIAVEKKKLIEDGKIPKEKKLQEIRKEEIPFKIPESWRWARVQDVASYITDYVANGSFATLKAHTKTYKEPNYALFVRTMDLSSGFKDGCSYIDKESYDFLGKSKLFGGELILPNIGASIGKAFIMPDMKMPMSLAPNSILLKFTEPIMNEYFSFVVKSTYGGKLLNKTQGGSATAKFSKTDLRSLVVPLPPLKEIIRIVDTLNKTLELIA